MTKSRFQIPELADLPNADAFVEIVRTGDSTQVNEFINHLDDQIALLTCLRGAIDWQRRNSLAQHTRAISKFTWTDEYSADDGRWVDVATIADRFFYPPGTVRDHCRKYGIGVPVGNGWRVSIDRAKQLYYSDRVRRR